MATCDDPPVLLDALLANWESSATSLEQKVTESDAEEGSGELVEGDGAWINDENEDDSEVDDEDEYGELEGEHCELEEEEGEDGEYEYEWVCYDEMEGEEEETPCPDEDYDGPDIDKNLFLFHASDEGFKESNLEERRKRRFLIGTHSFLDLADPHLEEALEPPFVEPEPEPAAAGDDAQDGKDEEEGEEDELEAAFTGRVCIQLKDEKDHYKEYCKNLGVRPDPTVMASLRERVMDLRNMGMNAKEITAVCQLLEENQFVQYRILAGNAVGLQGGLALAQLITKNTTIISYDLAGTEILEVFDVICEAMADNPSLIHLNFSKNELENLDMPSIKKILLGASPLQSLDLSANLIKDDGLRNIGQGLMEHPAMESIDLSHNKLRGEKQAQIFFTACADMPTLKVLNLKRNFIGEDGGKGVGRVFATNPSLEILDLSFNQMQEAAAAAIGKGLSRLERRELKTLQVEINRWHQLQGAAVLHPFGNQLLDMPIDLVDFGMMLDIHKEFIDAKEKALRVRPDMKIIHGQTFGMDHAKGPDLATLLIQRADAVCKSFETPLVMLMDELSKEKYELTTAEFRKFIKQCNLYKDKSLTESFEKVFALSDNSGGVNAAAILEKFDEVYPGQRTIPEPIDETEEEMEVKPEEKKKGKKGGKGKGKSAAALPVAGAGGAKGKGSKKKGKK